MYTIVICDDDQIFVDYLCDLIQKIASEDRDIGGIFIEKYYSGEDFVNHMNNKYDLVILDMQMEPIDGMATAMKLRRIDQDTVLVFCTGVQLPKPEFFEVQPFRYLMKFYDEMRLKRELSIILNRMVENKKDHYFVSIYDGCTRKINLEQIMYISNIKRGVILHIYDSQTGKREEIKDRSKLNSIYNAVKDKYFEYAHNSYIVNLVAIVATRRDVIVLKDGTELNISRTKKKDFHAAFVKYLGKEYMRESRRK